jgi:hypothetical protein
MWFVLALYGFDYLPFIPFHQNLHACLACFTGINVPWGGPTETIITLIVVCWPRPTAEYPGLQYHVSLANGLNYPACLTAAVIPTEA